MTRVKIGNIKPEMRNLEVVGEIVDIGEKIEIKTRFGPATITPAVLRDETGSIRLNLWRGQANIIRKGDRVMLVNAFVKTFKGNMELNIGRDGKIIVVNRKEEI